MPHPTMDDAYGYYEGNPDELSDNAGEETTQDQGEDEFEDNIDWSSIELPTATNANRDDAAITANNRRWVCAYKILRLVKKDSLEIATNEMKELILLTDDDLEKIAAAIERDAERAASNPYDRPKRKKLAGIFQQNKRGRPKGTKNKPGHRAGGNRYHINHTETPEDQDEPDMWHELYNVPLPKDCPASPFVFKLLHRATRAIDVVAERKVIAFLSTKGFRNMDDHFFFNKEYWYKRVRMPFKSGRRPVMASSKSFSL